MQQRSIFYTLEQVLSADLLGAQVYSLIGDANNLQTVLGSTASLISNLILSPTDPSSLTLNLTNGFIASLQPVDSSSYGSLSANTQQVLQLGFNLQTNVVINNTLEAGQAQFVLIEAGFEQQDSDSVVLPYVNISNPAVPYNGPGNTGIGQDTVRNETAVITVTYGTPATSGSQVAPTVSSGNVPIAYIDLEAGQTTITSGQILNPDTVAGGSPSAVLTGLLNSHHGGLVGQAPKINLPTEVQGLLPMANLLASNIVGGVTAMRQGSGNPNNVLAGNSNRNGVPDTYYDYTNNIQYVCTTTGTSSTAVWTSTNLAASTQFNLKVFNTSGSYTPSVGTKYIVVAVCGGGGGGGGVDGATDQGEVGGAGGGGSSAIAILPTTGLTFPATITIGTGGAGGSGSGESANTSGHNGNNSQFSTTEIGTNLTGYAGEGGVNAYTVSANVSPQGGRGGGALQSAALLGTITVRSVAYPYMNIYGQSGANDGGGDVSGGIAANGAAGGASMFGGGGAGGWFYESGVLQGPYAAQTGGTGGGGGSSGFSNAGAHPGANGSNGVCMVIEFVGN